jgi:protease-4
MEKNTETGVAWERDVVEKLLLANVREQRSARRWKIFFRFLVLGYFVALLYFAVGGDVSTKAVHVGDHTAVIDIDDIIGADEIGITADAVLKGAKSAFEDKATKGVVLRINSPGGSPVQSARIYKGLKRLREQHKEIPLYAVIDDVGASGAYYIAAVADEIYANESSIVGSIGVIMNNFGFVDAMNKLGIERRMLTAGENKGALDPFSPLKPEDEAHAQKLLDEVHQQFIEAVRQGRGDRLADNDDIFSGLFWSGLTAKEYGLIDGFGDADYVARELVGEESLVDFTTVEDPFERFARRLGMGMVEGFKILATASAPLLD